MKRLINCPKCHKDMAVLRKDCFVNKTKEMSYQVYCFNCGERTLFYDDEERAVEAWNNLSLKSFMEDIDNHMVENSFDSIVAIQNFDDKNICAYTFPIDDYCTMKDLFIGLVNQMCSVNGRFSNEPILTKEEIIKWIKEG